MLSDFQSTGQSDPSFIETARRAQIMECAVDAIAELGFAKAALAQIAKRARVSSGVIHYYFTSKEELIRAVVAHVFALGEAFVRPRVCQTSAPAALRSFIEGMAGFVAAYPRHCAAVVHIVRAGRAETGVAWFDPAVVRPRHAGITAILQAGHATGAFRPFDVRVMANTIIEALDTISAELVAEPGLDVAAYGQELAELFHRATRSDTAA